MQNYRKFLPSNYKKLCIHSESFWQSDYEAFQPR